MNNLEKIILSILTFSLISCAAYKKEGKIFQPYYSQEQGQFVAEDASRVIDNYYFAIRNRDKESYLNCLSERNRDLEEKYSLFWEDLVKIGKFEIKSRKLVGSSKNRRIYEVIEVYETHTGKKGEELCYYYLVRKDGWTIDDIRYNLDIDWLKE